MTEAEYNIESVDVLVGTLEGDLQVIRPSIQRERFLFDISLSEVGEYIKPQGFSKMVEEARRFPVSLLIGEDGIGKAGLAKLLALELHQNSEKIVKVYRTRERGDWSTLLPDVADEKSAKLIILAFDVNLEEVGAELVDIAKYAQDQEIKLFLTVDQQSYDSACSNTGLREVINPNWHQIKIVPTQLYSSHKRKELLEHFVKKFNLDSAASQLVDANHSGIILTLQDPSKLQRFISLVKYTGSLNSEKLQQLLIEAQELSRMASTWVNSLSLNHSYFALTLALFPELDEDDFFIFYEDLIRNYWRERRPELGLLDYREILELSPHVVFTKDGIRFGDENFQSIVGSRLILIHKRALKVILPFLLANVVGPENDNQDSNKDIRITSALAIGEIGKVDFQLISEMLRPLAEHRRGRIRAAVGHVLCKALEYKDNQNIVLSLLGEWSRDGNPHVRWAAASAYGRIGRSKLGLVIDDLKRMAQSDSDFDVRRSVAYAFRVLAMSKLEDADIQRVLRILAMDQDRRVREEVAAVFEGLTVIHIDQVKRTLSEWLTDPQVRWTATLALVSIGLSRPKSVSVELVQYAESGSENANILQFVLSRVAKSVQISDGLDRLMWQLITTNSQTIIKTVAQAIEFALEIHNPDDVRRAQQKAIEVCQLFDSWIPYDNPGANDIILVLLSLLASHTSRGAANLIGKILDQENGQIKEQLLDMIVLLTTDAVQSSNREHTAQLLYACALAPLRIESKSQILVLVNRLIDEEPMLSELVIERILADLSAEYLVAFEVTKQLIFQEDALGDTFVDRPRFQTLAGCAVTLEYSKAIIWFVMQVCTLQQELAMQLIEILINVSDSQIRKLGIESAYSLMAANPELMANILHRLAQSSQLRLEEVHEKLGEDLFKDFYAILKLEAHCHPLEASIIENDKIAITVFDIETIDDENASLNELDIVILT